MLISFIIPTYNGDKYLEKCLNSILNQNLKNFEIIIIDGGSKDGTLNIVNKYLQKDNSIKLIHQKGKGLGNARNIGIDNAEGEYITFIDCDDFISQNFIDSFAMKMNEGYDMIIGGFVKYKSEKDSKQIFIKDNGIGKYLDTGPWGRFVKKSFLKEKNIRFLDNSLREDAHFNITVFNYTRNIAIINYAGYYYRISNNDSMCKTICRKFDPGFIEWLNKMGEIKPIDDENKEMKNYAIIRACIFYLLYSGRYLSSKDFIFEYKKLFKWLKYNISGYWKNKYLRIFTNSENVIIYKIGITGFILLDKLHLVPLFARIRCKQ